MPLCSFVDYRLACSCLYFWVYAFSLFLLAVEVTNFFVLFFLIAGPVCTYWCVTKYSIPPPNESTVNEILGKELEGEIICRSNTDCTNVNGGVQTYSEEPNDFILKVIAHRFAGIEAPENSLEALDLCYKNGAVAVEFDLILTADLVPVIFHDASLDRITDIIGDITEKTWSELKHLDISVKHPFHEKYKGTRIPLYEDVIKKCMEYDLRIFIDVKEDRSEVVNVILNTYERYPKMYKRSVVSSFNPVLLYHVRRANPDIVVSMAWRPYYMSCRTYSVNTDQCIPYSKFLPSFCFARLLDFITTWIFNNVAHELIGFSAVVIVKDVVTPEFVLSWKARNVRTYAWTINNHIEKLHFARNLGVGYFTDSMLGQESL